MTGVPSLTFPDKDKMKNLNSNDSRINSAAKILLLIFSVFSQRAYSQTWSTLSTGMNDWVYSSTVYNGDLIVGGNFTSAGGVSADHIARWDGNTWHPLGSHAIYCKMGWNAMVK